MRAHVSVNECVCVNECECVNVRKSTDEDVDDDGDGDVVNVYLCACDNATNDDADDEYNGDDLSFYFSGDGTTSRFLNEGRHLASRSKAL